MRAASAAIVVFTGALALVSLPLASQQAPHGVHNDDADGTSWLAGGSPRIVHGPLPALGSGQTLVVVGPTVPYAAGEVAAIRAFLESGGRVLVADAQGTGVDLLAALDVGVFLAGVPIYTPVFEDDPASPLVHSTGRIDGLPSQVSLARPTAVVGAGDAVLATHEVSWLDANGNGRPDLDEERAAFAFSMVRRVGAGELLVVGSARVFDNAGHPLRDGLLAWATDGRELVLDEGHRRAVDPVQVGSLLAGQARWTVWLLPVALGIVALRVTNVRLVRRAPRRGPAPTAPPAVLEELEP